MEEDVFKTEAEKMDQDSPGKNTIGDADGAVNSTWATKCSPGRLKWRTP